MTYEEYKQWIKKLAANASPESCRRFAADSIARLAESASEAIKTDLTAAEQHLMSELLRTFMNGQPDVLAKTLKELVYSTGEDEVRAIELSPTLTALMCAISNWIDYLRTPSPASIVRLAINASDGVDYEIAFSNVSYGVGSDSKAYSIRNMLGDPRMVEEIQRQERLLSPSTGR